MHKRFSPDILFLSETKNANDFVLRKCDSLGYKNSLLISPQGHGSGGLALFWNQGINLTISESCKNFINVEICYENKRCRASFVYGDLEPIQRRTVWQKLTEAALVRDEAWFLIGDFNDIANSQEKTGGRDRSEGSFGDFRAFLSECDLYDLPHTGDFLSWRGVRGDDVVRCRLDRAIANSQWFDLFHSGSVEYLKYEGSDHRPILACFDVTKKKGKGLFRFDRRLKENPEIKALVGDTWKQAGNRDVQYKIGQTRRAIVLWNKEQQRNSKLLINKWKDELERAMTSPNNDSDLLNHINSELKSAYLEEEAFWKQRSRNLWLSLGDRNSGYFHAVTKGRNAVNNFSVIENADGEPVFTEKEITGTIVDYFKGLFTTVPGERKQIVTQAISPKISTLENKLFYKPHQQQKCTRRYLQFIRTKHQVRMGFLQVSSKLIGQLSEKILYLRSRSSSLPV